MDHPSESDREKRDLIGVIHGIGGRSERLRYVVDVVHRTWKRDGKPEPIVYCPEMGFSMASFDDPCEITKRLLNAIDTICEQHAEIGKIILVGYSFGSLIV
ncbi:hypothetical protein AB4Y44_10040 [Paraburkholderia sp. BR10937]|uniref:alpha/beta hydrolase n=1 Tax=Paraburkholderia sp. BR10937 TaxID=3236994 RepID=UPI0034D20106